MMNFPAGLKAWMMLRAERLRQIWVAAHLSSSSHTWCFVAPSIYFITRAPDILGSVRIFGECWDVALEGGGGWPGWPLPPLWNIAQVQKTHFLHRDTTPPPDSTLSPCLCCVCVGECDAVYSSNPAACPRVCLFPVHLQSINFASL